MKKSENNFLITVDMSMMSDIGQRLELWFILKKIDIGVLHHAGSCALSSAFIIHQVVSAHHVHFPFEANFLVVKIHLGKCSFQPSIKLLSKKVFLVTS